MPTSPTECVHFHFSCQWYGDSSLPFFFCIFSPIEELNGGNSNLHTHSHTRIFIHSDVSDLSERGWKCGWSKSSSRQKRHLVPHLQLLGDDFHTSLHLEAIRLPLSLPLVQSSVFLSVFLSLLFLLVNWTFPSSLYSTMLTFASRFIRKWMRLLSDSLQLFSFTLKRDTFPPPLNGLSLPLPLFLSLLIQFLFLSELSFPSLFLLFSFSFASLLLLFSFSYSEFSKVFDANSIMSQHSRKYPFENNSEFRSFSFLSLSLSPSLPLFLSFSLSPSLPLSLSLLSILFPFFLLILA
jgi:hypothetical protein